MSWSCNIVPTGQDKVCQELYCCFVDKQSDKSAMQHRESFVEINIDAFVDANATIDIDDINCVNGVDGVPSVVKNRRFKFNSQKYQQR